MYCSKCGNKISDGDKFCSRCGTKVSTKKANKIDINKVLNSFSVEQPYINYDKTQYKMFEEFKYSVIGDMCYFVLTDRSLLFNGKEYLYSDMSIIRLPRTFTLVFLPMSINGDSFQLKVSSKDTARFFLTVIKVNDKIQIRTPKDKLQHLVSLQNCYYYLYYKHSFTIGDSWLDKMTDKHLSKYMFEVKRKESDKYPSLMYYHDINEENLLLLNDYERFLVNELLKMQERLNDFYTNTDFVPDKYRGFFLWGVFDEILDRMTDSDIDMKRAIEQYEEDIRQEELKRQLEIAETRERIANGEYYESHKKSSSVIGDIAKTAAGVAIGNKISGMGSNKSSRSSSRKEAKYICSTGCPYRGKDYGPTKCRRNPATCGNGIRYW